jgi:hypothetical protein
MRTRRTSNGDIVFEIEGITGSNFVLGDASYKVTDETGITIAMPKRVVRHVLLVLLDDYTAQNSGEKSSVTVQALLKAIGK